MLGNSFSTLDKLLEQALNAHYLGHHELEGMTISKMFAVALRSLLASMQAGSLEFLAGQGFDFNKWIYEGVPFMPDEWRKK